MHTEGHDLGKNTAGGTRPANENNPEQPGYETTDVNVNGVVVFLAGLGGFVLIFFVFCFGMGKVINNIWEKQDGPATKWKVAAGDAPANGKREDLASNPEMQQKELQRMTTNFPQPRLDIDDGNQATADLHAKEDLLLGHYSSVPDQQGTVRIPIDRAMELIVQRGLPVVQARTTAATQVAEAGKPDVTAPLTTGFARTGYELTTIEARAQKMSFEKAGEVHAVPVMAK